MVNNMANTIKSEYKLIRCINEESLLKMHGIREKILFTDGEYDRNHADDKNPNNHCFIYMKDDNAIGTVRLDFIEKNMAAVRLVAILHEYQGQGIGAKMLSAIEDYAKQHAVYNLVTNAEIKAEGFYKALGYANDKWVDPGEGISRPTTPMTKKLT